MATLMGREGKGGFEILYKRHWVLQGFIRQTIYGKVHITNVNGPVLMSRRNKLGGVIIRRTQYRIWGNCL